MSKKMWGGRFGKKTDPLVEEFTKSIHYDNKLALYDCLGSLAHIDILKKASIVNAKEHKKLKKGLEEIISDIKKDSFKIDNSFEDIHSYIQSVLEKKAGAVALKLHTARSRNDQIVFDVKFFCKDYIEHLKKLLRAFVLKLSNTGEKIVMPGYTHLQHAIPVTVSDYLIAYAEMLQRDYKRLDNASANIILTMGSGALAGTFIDSSKYNVSIKSPMSSKTYKIESAYNSLDTVSDRDFVMEILSALAIVGMHLSRLSDDLILWSSKEFDFIDIDDAFCTGSSLMPQKKNPDILELIRGYSGKLYGNLMSVSVMMKGLPLSYNRDMQLDKEPLFDSFKIVEDELTVFSLLLPKIKFKKANIERALKDECLFATDMADYLVQKGVAFKEAHSIIGKIVAYKLKTGKNIKDLKAEEIKKFHKFLSPKAVKEIMDPKRSVTAKKSIRRKNRKV